MARAAPVPCRYIYGGVYPLPVGPSAGAKLGLACAGGAHATLEGVTIGRLDLGSV
jgi:hypothetical protein